MMYYLPDFQVLRLDPQTHSVLAAQGRQDSVTRLRRELLDVMREVLVAAVEELTGRHVTGLMTDSDPTNDIRVANMSLGGGGANDNNCGNSNADALHQAICRSIAAGVPSSRSTATSTPERAYPTDPRTASSAPRWSARRRPVIVIGASPWP